MMTMITGITVPLVDTIQEAAMGSVTININDVAYTVGVGSTVVYKVDGEPRKLSIFRDDGDRFVAVDVRTANIKYIYKELSSDIADLRLRVSDITPVEAVNSAQSKRIHIVDGVRIDPPMTKQQMLAFDGLSYARHDDGRIVPLPIGTDIPDGTTYFTTLNKHAMQVVIANHMIQNQQPSEV